MNTHPHRTRTAAALAAVASLAVVGGTLASFTDSDTTTEQVMTAGTVNIDLVEGAGWADNLDNLGVGDTFTRTVLLDNTSTLPIGSARISSELTDSVGEFGGELSESVAVDIVQVDGNVRLADDVRLADLADGYNLVFAGGRLEARTDVNLRFEYEVLGARPAAPGNRSKGARELTDNPDNKYQGSSLTVAYTLDAVQRPGMDVGVAAAPQTFDVARDANNVTLTFDTPATNPAGTVYTATWAPAPATGAASARAATFAARTTAAAATAPTTAAAAGSMSATTSPIRITGLAWETTYNFSLTAAAPNGISSAPLTSTVVIPRKAGTLFAWGSALDPRTNADVIKNAPTGGTEFVQVSAGNSHALGLSAAGSITGWGQAAGYALNTVPLAVSSRTVKYIEAGPSHNLVVFSDGTVGGWGNTANNRLNIPAGLTGVTQVSAGAAHSLALKSNGTVVQWGGSGAESVVPAGLTNVVQVVAADRYSYALKADGTTVAWGFANFGAIGAGMNANIKQLAATWSYGRNGGIALRNDGTVFMFGHTQYQSNIPAGLTNVAQVDIGQYIATAVKKDGTIKVWGDSRFGSIPPGGLSQLFTAVAPDSDGGVLALRAETLN